jgi:hypothetical protein
VPGIRYFTAGSSLHKVHLLCILCLLPLPHILFLTLGSLRRCTPRCCESQTDGPSGLRQVYNIALLSDFNESSLH